ncbi:ammonium transporter [Megalodesulfovibrio gigas]|uniref:Ammonium transporter n=1 Tax=Megalodesulfovibrio gigas (strain ATCC 19364 / DSM 1382 / NCIMB 9332 / VKM B-1759) TaxID=1121448 RepID=T2GEF0_MEGG1|nr:ammonium transporter [Megalodesulfovibrio gigas]AGW14287.1 putative ammonium transporter [Megalodesulfovibrio gigas DSM 1382 = ATCC 19364]
MQPADTAFILICAALVMFMTPGLALFYGGLTRNKNVLGTIMHSFIMLAVGTLVWVAVGYSLAFGDDIAGVIGSLNFAFLYGVGAEPAAVAPTIPHSTFMIFQCMFAVITPALISGAYAERIKFSGFLVFSVLWLILVYCPMAHWVWGGGWMAQMGALDFAGGAVVHMSSGAAALAAALVLGYRRGYGQAPFIPHNIPMTVLGAGILWFGWFGFNAGSALAANGLASSAFVTTHIAAAAAALAWIAMERIVSGKPTTLGAASGAVAGLVVITPAAGFVTPMGALLMGLSGGAICYGGIFLKHKLGFDDALDVVGIHGVGGTWGAIATGIFANAAVNGKSGLLQGDVHQFLVQVASVVATWVFCFGASYLLLKFTDMVVGLRVTPEEEEVGLDMSQHNESGYQY